MVSSARASRSFPMVRKHPKAPTSRAPPRGVSGVTIIAHGSSNARAIRNAIRAAANEALVNHVNVDIVNMLTKVPSAMVAKPAAGKGIRGLFLRVRDRLHRHRDANHDSASEEWGERIKKAEVVHPDAYNGETMAGGDHHENSTQARAQPMVNGSVSATQEGKGSERGSTEESTAEKPAGRAGAKVEPS